MYVLGWPGEFLVVSVHTGFRVVLEHVTHFKLVRDSAAGPRFGMKPIETYLL
jgi:hypothetical protein